MRAGLDLGIDVAEHFLKDDVDLGAPLVAPAGDPAQVLAAGLADADRGDIDGSTVRVFAGRLGSWTWPLAWAPA